MPSDRQAAVEKLLVAEKLCKSYGKTVVLHDVSLWVRPGECVALLGPNGAGKTTVCEILEGLIPQDSGTVRVVGLDYKHHKTAIHERIGVQLQETALYKKYTVRETLQLFASFYRETVPLDGLLGRLGLANKSSARLEHLSGGERQKLYLACALVHRPQLLFLDEPTTGLDPVSRHDLHQMILALKQDGVGILLTTHDLHEAGTLSDRLILLQRGQVIAQGRAQDLVTSFSEHDVLEWELQDVLAWEELQSKLPWLMRAQRLGERHFRLHVHRDDGVTKSLALLSLCQILGFNLLAFALRHGTLEDVFLKISEKN